MNQPTQDVGVAITAAGTTQATATELIHGLSWVTTVPAGSGVVLFAASQGSSQLVYNDTSTALNVYPPSGANINGLPTNTPHILAGKTAVQFWFLSATQLTGVLSA